MIQLLRNAEVFSPEPLGRHQLLIAGETVAWMGPEGTPVGLPPETVVEDLGGKRLIPGLIDCHVHLTGGGGEDGYRSRVPPLALSDFTQVGTTGAIGVLGTDDTTRGTALLLAAARGLLEEGLNAFCMTGGYHIPPVTLTGSVRTDIAHIDPIIAVGEIALSDHRSSQPTLDEILRIASDAHLAGLLTKKAGLVHFHLGDGERGLGLLREALATAELPARVFHPTHVNRKRALFDEALALAEQGCHIDVTAFPVEQGEDAYTATESVLRFLDSDLPRERLTVSSDAGGSLPKFDDRGALVAMEVAEAGTLGSTLAELLSRDVALENILPFFTSNVADHFRLHNLGRIQVGARADLVTLDEQGLPADVMLAGRWHLSRGRLVRSGTFETEAPNPEPTEESTQP